MATDPATIPDGVGDLFERDTIAHFGTVMPDGTPHITPVWVDHDDDTVLVNTVKGRQKERNVTDNPLVGISVVDPDDPYRYVSVRGTVTSVTTDGAADHIDTLAKRYMGVEEYPNHGEERGPRVIIRIRPDTVITNV